MIFLDRKYIKPELGQVKEVRKFAFLPKKIDDKIVFLSFYSSFFVFAETTVNAGEKILNIKSWVKIGDK